MATMAMKHEQTQRLWLPLSPNGGKNGATESAIAYAAFEKYYLMEKRSLRRVAHELGQSVKLLERWSSEFRWIDGAADSAGHSARRLGTSSKRASLPPSTSNDSGKGPLSRLASSRTSMSGATSSLRRYSIGWKKCSRFR